MPNVAWCTMLPRTGQSWYYNRHPREVFCVGHFEYTTHCDGSKNTQEDNFFPLIMCEVSHTIKNGSDVKTLYEDSDARSKLQDVMLL